MVSLRKINMDNFHEVISLKLDDQDKQMVAHNMYSLAEAYADQVSICRGIYNDDTLVGFVMYDFNESEKKGYISRLMIDQKYQRQGFGRDGLRQALDHLKSFPGIEKIQISYHPENKKARLLYLDLGFIENGEFVDEEVVAMLELQ